MRNFFWVLLPLCVQASALASDPAEAETSALLFAGDWINERGSGVTFTVGEGRLSGHYQTALGQPDRSQRFPLTGFVEGDQITFTVNFEGFDSLTSWTGQASVDAAGEPFIRTLWHLTRDVSDEEEEDGLWSSIVSGASEFRRPN